MNINGCGHVWHGSEPGTICDSCGRIHKAQEWLESLPGWSEALAEAEE